jgi:hypothetical protein
MALLGGAFFVNQAINHFQVAARVFFPTDILIIIFASLIFEIYLRYMQSHSYSPFNKNHFEGFAFFFFFSTDSCVLHPSIN